MRLKDDLFATERSQSHASGIRRASRASGGYWRLGQLCPPPLPPLPPPQPPCRRTWGRALFMDGAGCATTLAGRAEPGVAEQAGGVTVLSRRSPLSRPSGGSDELTQGVITPGVAGPSPPPPTPPLCVECRPSGRSKTHPQHSVPTILSNLAAWVRIELNHLIFLGWIGIIVAHWKRR